MQNLQRRNSKQRQIILKAIKSTKSHPTAEEAYCIVKQEIPNISLGTVYRNLNLLAEIGEIKKISCGSGCDRFDGMCEPHAHIVCPVCGKVKDFEYDISKIISDVKCSCSQDISGVVLTVYGTCESCEKVD